MLFPVKVFTKICILQERKKKYEQNLVLRKRTTETTPQRKIQELQERASQRQIKREKIENRRGAEEEERKNGVQRQRCTSFMQSLEQAVFFLSLLPDCPFARSAFHGRQPICLPTYLPQGNDERVCNT
jgi:hypothetical protein